MLGIIGHVDNDCFRGATPLANSKSDAAGQSVPHQTQIVKPDLPAAHLRMFFTVDDRDDHRVFLRPNILGQQRLLGRRPHGGFLAGNELRAQCLCQVWVGSVEKRLEIRLVLRAKIQMTAQTQKLHDGQVDRYGRKSTGRGGFFLKTRTVVKGTGQAFADFEIVQCSLKHRQVQDFERADFHTENTHGQRTPEAEERLVDIDSDLAAFLQRLRQ